MEAMHPGIETCNDGKVEGKKRERGKLDVEEYFFH